MDATEALMLSPEEVQALVARTAYLEQRNKELEDEVFDLKCQLKARERDSLKGCDASPAIDVTLKSWIKSQYDLYYDSTARKGGQKDLWKQVLMPYVAAYCACRVQECSLKIFNRIYMPQGVEVPSTPFSNWTKNYFYIGQHSVYEAFLYNQIDLTFWWKRLGVSDEDICKTSEMLMNHGIL